MRGACVRERKDVWAGVWCEMCVSVCGVGVWYVVCVCGWVGVWEVGV